jgi:hypothetical protein
MQDDSRQDEIYHSLPSFLDNNVLALERELDDIREWYATGHPYFHFYKMARAKDFQPGNLALSVA